MSTENGRKRMDGVGNQPIRGPCFDPALARSWPRLPPPEFVRSLSVAVAGRRCELIVAISALTYRRHVCIIRPFHGGPFLVGPPLCPNHSSTFRFYRRRRENRPCRRNRPCRPCRLRPTALRIRAVIVPNAHDPRKIRSLAACLHGHGYLCSLADGGACTARMRARSKNAIAGGTMGSGAASTNQRKLVKSADERRHVRGHARR